MKTIKPSARLSRVKRLFDPYQDRSDYVRLDRNEDPAGWDAPHFEALRKSLSPHDLAAYADSTRFIEKLVRWLGVSADSVLVTAGSDAAIKCVFETYVDPGNEILMQDPNWRMYEVYNNVYQGRATLVQYDRALGFDIGGVRRAVRERAPRMVLLANPNQPTGTLIDDAEVEGLIADAAGVGTLVVMDEAYHLFTPHTAVPWVSRYSNLIVTRTFSKAFGLAGLRLGYCVAQPERIRELSLLRPVTDANSLALKCAEYALDHMDWMNARVADFVAGREFLYRQMAEAGLEVFRSHTNFLLLRCPSMDSGSNLIAEVRRHKYLLKGPFGMSPLEKCVRVSIGPLALMQRFWSDCGAILTRFAARRAA